MTLRALLAMGERRRRSGRSERPNAWKNTNWRQNAFLITDIREIQQTRNLPSVAKVDVCGKEFFVEVDPLLGPRVPRHDGQIQYWCSETGAPKKMWQQMNTTEMKTLILMAAKRATEWSEEDWLKTLFGAWACLTKSVRAPLAIDPNPSPEDDREMRRTVHSDEEPLLVLWYSGGFSADEGRDLVQQFVDEARIRGIEDALILRHSMNKYGLTGEGYWQWPFYVAKCIDKINEVSATRPLLLFGHSTGTCPALSVASSCGSRVLKVYVAACGSWGIRSETPWESLARDFKAQENGDRALLAWFCSLNPTDILLPSIVRLPDNEFQDAITSSKLLKHKLNLLRTQYKDAMYPDMKTGPAIDTFLADIMTAALARDPGANRERVMGFKAYTSGEFSICDIEAGHMDCLSNPQFLKTFIDDMLRFFR